ncbi:MAG: hypothetical protein K2N56_13295 [Oscillospiraceae bacterium]|nr:hypothetical protein [Oscillospiraceae bacterium]
MREVLTAFVVPHFCALIADDTGLIFKVKKNGEWKPAAMLRYSRMEYAEFHGSNVIIEMMSGKKMKASVLQKKRLMEIFDEKGVACVDAGANPFYRE